MTPDQGDLGTISLLMGISGAIAPVVQFCGLKRIQLQCVRQSILNDIHQSVFRILLLESPINRSSD